MLLHGIGGSRHDWSPLTGALEREFEVLAVDLPGFGDSPPDADLPVTIDGQADAVGRALDAAGVDRVHLVGNSSGGWLALELARRERARSVVALAPAGMWSPREDRYRYSLLRNAHYSARVIRRYPALTRTAPRRWMLGMWLFMARPGRWSPEEMQTQMEALGGAESFMDFLRWTRGRAVEGLGDVHCPVLIAWGSRDFLLPRRQADRFVDAIPGAELRLLQGVGHVPMADNPELIGSAIRDFANRAEAALA